MIELLALIIIGGTAVPTSVFGIARKLVYRQTDPLIGERYLQWFREEKAREQAEAVRAELARLSAAAELMRPTQQEWLDQRRRRPNATAPRNPKELTYR